MVPRCVFLHPKTYQRLSRLRAEAEQEGAYRVAKRIHAVLLNADGHTSGRIAEILKAPRSKASVWLANYEAYGENGLLEGHRSGRPPELSVSTVRPIDLCELARRGFQAEKGFGSGGANRLEMFPQDAHAPNVALTAYFPEERRAGDIWELGDPLRQVRLKGVQFGRNGGSGEPIFGRAIVGG
jgi:hypothetical protein